MDRKLEFRCPKCGKQLNGTTLDYKLQWTCSECTDDKTDVLHCEKGCKVRAVRLNVGMSGDSKQAHEFLKEGQVYEVGSLNVGGWISHIVLKEFPGQRFNTVHFDRCE